MAGGTRSPRERMVYSAVQLVRTRGANGTGVRDVVEHARAPRGSFQHYFPGGKDQLVGEAVLWAADYAADWARAYRATARRPTPAGLFAHLARQWKQEFGRRGFDRGCPLMAAAADLVGAGSVVAEQLRDAIERWEAAVAGELVAMDVPPRRAKRLATLMISTLEGAIMSARVRGDAGPLTTVVAELAPLLDG
ncbi:TetR/AcrR family transcriptional regulator [Actinophytocola algeriensis]|uniref:AcrR family transcriptional regulator n=1 Tax=Actinophytocola algeriensis TaxID=1768010 RepID=A0A7W7VGS3_9PSEU|nr:TetR/AcrR family transcriptional regulator [Actinophytocola algeriensis]MBB4909646.1 AcrR family transcriptional regulator [Actinophytocola algeriensis]MBE1475636.1 AcrR family transcriptional regulator [Actinophytocola algeriensis]